MGSILCEGKHLENGGPSVLIPPPKYKRRKISAVRDFPPGCGPNATLVCKQTTAKAVQGVGELNVSDVVNEVLKDIENCGEKGEDLLEAERKELLELTVQLGCPNEIESKASILAPCGNLSCNNEGLKNLPAENTDTVEEVQNLQEKAISGDSKHDSVNDSMDVSAEIPSTLKKSETVDPKATVDTANNNTGKDDLLPHYPIPPNIVRKKLKYPPPRKVSAVRTFPSGCGPNLTSRGPSQVVEGKSDTMMNETGILNQNEGNLEGNNEKGFAVNMIMQAPMLGQSFEINGREENQEHNDEKHMQEMEQLTNVENDEMDTESLPDRLMDDDIVVYVKDKNKKNKPVGGSNNIELQEGSIHDIEIEKREKEKSVDSYNDDIELQEETMPGIKIDHGKKKKSVGASTNNIELQEDGIPDIKIEKGKKKKSVGVSTNNIKLQEESILDVKIEKEIVVQGIMCAASSPWSKVKEPAKPSPIKVGAKESKGKKHVQDKTTRPRGKAKDSAEKEEEKSMMIVPYLEEREKDEVSPLMALSYDEDSSENDEHNDFQFLPRPREIIVAPPLSIAGPSSEKGARSMVRETLKLYQVIVRKILQGEETKSKEKGKAGKRVDILAAQMLKAKGKYINTVKKVGAVPGVEIGDIFSYRIELAIIGLHSPLQSGIDTIKQGKRAIAISVVASGGYDNDVDNSDVLIYTGQGGNPIGPDKQPEDQKLDRANLALKNCIDEKSPVRVIRGFKETKSSDNGDGRSKKIATYTYDGLYTVQRCWPDRGSHGKIVYKFELRRIPGQRQLAWKEVKQSKKCKLREGHCVDDISEGKEKSPICAINTIDDEKPPPFTYITSVMYPDWCRPIPLQGCHCKGGCSDSDRCACAIKNGGEIPYNLSGAIVMEKPLVYECGPSCKCPPSCANRVSQHGIKHPLEIFKTESRGWGVRSLSAIPSGSFICEYIGELLDDKEAELRVGSDEYLFDIGQNYNDSTLSDGLSAVMPDMPSMASDIVENIGFTIDAARFGNIGRFINHSCSPNLYAQNVLYDYEDKRIPHIMMFAAENIPPLQELTYHYNYSIDQVFDSEGNIKKKDCFCGSAECSGRMY